MVWFFERDDQSVRVETRYDRQTKEYVLVVDRGNRRARTERFKTEARFEARLRQLQERFASEHWILHGPVLQRDGWKL
jgi:hypothetical protein